MGDGEALLRAFLEGRIEARNFHHRDHVRAGFELLSRRSFCEALVAYSDALRRITAAAGNPGAYHETITVAFLSLIAERRIGAEHTCFDTFAAENPDLLDRNVLARWYSPDRLTSAAARQTFILPGGPEPAAG